MISPIIKWDHSENYVVPLFDSYNFFEKRNVSINLSDKIFEFVQGHIIDGECLTSISLIESRNKTNINYFNCRKGFVPRNGLAVFGVGNFQHDARRAATANEDRLRRRQILKSDFVAEESGYLGDNLHSSRLV